MARYRIENTIVDTDNASMHWDEATVWNGNNWISKATGSQWEHETLYRSRKGRYYVEHTSQWQGRLPTAEWISPQEAVRWLLTNDYPVTNDDLLEFVDEITE